MVESLIMLLIYVCLIAAAVFLIIWVCEQIGIPLPPKVIQMFYVIAGLIVLLLLWRMLGPALSGAHLPR